MYMIGMESERYNIHGLKGEWASNIYGLKGEWVSNIHGLKGEWVIYMV